LRGILPRFSFRVPECERGLEALCAYHTVRETSTGIARDEPCHDASSHASDALRVLAEAESAHYVEQRRFDSKRASETRDGPSWFSGGQFSRGTGGHPRKNCAQRGGTCSICR
jgi:hypothetical protein